MAAREAKNRRLAMICAAIFAAMVGLAFAFVPLYRAFCQATGFNGTVRRAEAVTNTATGRTITVRFDTNVRGLPWTFNAVQLSQTAEIGESKLAFFEVTNTGSTPLTGRAVYNVMPESAAPFFSKLECFCFTNQTIAPGHTARFPVVYYVDPRFGLDDDTRGIGQITLSYTFFPARPLAAAAAQGYSTSN